MSSVISFCFGIESMKRRITSKLKSSCFSLPSSCDCGCVPLCPASSKTFWLMVTNYSWARLLTPKKAGLPVSSKMPKDDAPLKDSERQEPCLFGAPWVWSPLIFFFLFNLLCWCCPTLFQVSFPRKTRGFCFVQSTFILFNWIFKDFKLPRTLRSGPSFKKGTPKEDTPSSSSLPRATFVMWP